MFRFMFTSTFLILGADGIRPHHHVNESMFWTDFLAMVGAFGCCVSSALTLVVRPESLLIVRDAPVLTALMQLRRSSSPDPQSRNIWLASQNKWPPLPPDKLWNLGKNHGSLLCHQNHPFTPPNRWHSRLMMMNHPHILMTSPTALMINSPGRVRHETAIGEISMGSLRFFRLHLLSVVTVARMLR